MLHCHEIPTTMVFCANASAQCLFRGDLAFWGPYQHFYIYFYIYIHIYIHIHIHIYIYI